MVFSKAKLLFMQKIKNFYKWVYSVVHCSFKHFAENHKRNGRIIIQIAFAVTFVNWCFNWLLQLWWENTCFEWIVNNTRRNRRYLPVTAFIDYIAYVISTRWWFVIEILMFSISEIVVGLKPNWKINKFNNCEELTFDSFIVPCNVSAILEKCSLNFSAIWMSSLIMPHVFKQRWSIRQASVLLPLQSFKSLYICFVSPIHLLILEK